MTRTDYEQIAGVFDRRYQGGRYAGAEQVVLDLLGPSRGRRALEVGCGTGHWLELLHKNGFEVTGLDASPGMLEQARARLPSATLVHGSAEQLPFPDAGFDCVLCINALHHFGEPRGFMAEAHRVLGAGGILINIGLDPHQGIDRWFVYDYFEATRELDLKRYASVDTVRRWLDESGFLVDGTRLAVHIERQVPASEALAKGIDPRDTSQLALLTPEAFAAGVDRIRQEEARARQGGGELALVVDLRMWATVARKP
ncbi:class I SAM-dependent methyltransferase [Sorangium sp. So ce385]|uniref:class I SAM-dependent methyltransferase n=1 Tax=Sorangium sp. So ce385 TaxID=3133308 RepID=UPI003F5C35DA